MNKPQTLSPREEKEVDAQREDHRSQQPYASELDDRELEHAHKEKRPVQPPVQATDPARPGEASKQG
jgi:hypothetical protein